MKQKKLIILLCLIAVAVLLCYILTKYDFFSDEKNKEDDSDHILSEEVAEEEELSETEIGIYSINYDNQECEPTILVVPENQKVNERYIVNEVIANFNTKVMVKDVIKQDNDIIITFEKNSPPACDVSPAMEELMLNCIAFSLLDNIENSENIYFRIDDEPYRGVNIVTESDEPYISSDISGDEDE